MGPDQINAPLPDQFASTNKLREIPVSGGEGKRSIFIQTCTTTCMNYALYFTGRIPLKGMAERIENDVQHLIDIGRIVAHVDANQSEAQGTSNVLFILTQRENVPVCGLIFNENGYSWKEYLTRWMKEKGVALISSGGHMRILAMDVEGSQTYEFDPGRNQIRVPVQIDILTDADAREITLIPPKNEDCSQAMREMLLEQLDVLRGYPGGKKYATDVDYLSVYPYYSQKILERDYFPDESKLVQIGDESQGSDDLGLALPIVVDVQTEPETGVDADLPSVQVSDANRGDDADIVVLDPETPAEGGTDGIVINIPPDSE